MTGIEIANEMSFDLWRGAPAPDSEEDDWNSYKQRTYDDFVHLVRAIDRQLSAQPYVRLERLRRLRREHHLILVADRIRREAPAGSKFTLDELRSGAERIVDRGARLGAARADEARPRSRSDEKMMISARVHWHKLLRKADSRAELRGMWGGKSRYSGINTIVGRIIGQRPKKGAQQALREHIRDRLEQLLAVSNEVIARTGAKPTRQDRLLVRDLEGLLRRAQTAISHPDSTTRSRPRKDLRSVDRSSAAPLESRDRQALRDGQGRNSAANAGA